MHKKYPNLRKNKSLAVGDRPSYNKCMEEYNETWVVNYISNYMCKHNKKSYLKLTHKNFLNIYFKQITENNRIKYERQKRLKKIKEKKQQSEFLIDRLWDKYHYKNRVSYA
jgi:putative cell wall-binding protein